MSPKNDFCLSKANWSFFSSGFKIFCQVLSLLISLARHSVFKSVNLQNQSAAEESLLKVLTAKYYLDAHEERLKKKN